MRNPLVNLALFQLCWLANVVGAARGVPWLGPLCTAAWLTGHLAAAGPARRAEGALVAAAAALGYATDSLLVLGGLLAFPEAARLGSPSTLWMVALWAGFAAALPCGLGWLRGRLGWAALAGAAGGPLAYWAGTRLGAVSLPRPDVGLAAIGLQWLVAAPLLLAGLAWAEARLGSGRRGGGAPGRERPC